MACYAKLHHYWRTKAGKYRCTGCNWNEMQVLGNGPFVKWGTNVEAFRNPVHYIEARMLLLRQSVHNDSSGLSLNA